MGINLKDFLDHLMSDESYIISVREKGYSIYYGYNTELPKEFNNLIVDCVYLDFASNALGIDTK